MWKKPKPDSPKIVFTVSGEKMLMGVGVLEQKVESISFLRCPLSKKKKKSVGLTVPFLPFHTSLPDFFHKYVP